MPERITSKTIIGFDPAKHGKDITATTTFNMFSDGSFMIETIFTNPKWVRAEPPPPMCVKILPKSKIAKINRRIQRSLERKMKGSSHARTPNSP